MRKVSSAPALQDLGRTQPDQHTSGRIPKAGSTSNLRRKDLQTLAKVRVVTAGSLPFLVDQPVDPGVLTDFQDISGSAKGLAGFECFEKFGQQQPAPSLQDDRERNEPVVLRAQSLKEDENNWALASCLATPYAADERNLGEEVETAARENALAEREELIERVEATVEKPERDVSRTHEKDDRKSPQRRKRRLLEALGLGESDPRPGDAAFDDNELAQQYLAQHSSMEALSNRLHLPDGWACNEEICHPVFNADYDLFTASFVK